MAKRHPALVPLAQDHYNALLLAVRLRQGEHALTKFWSHDPFWQARHVVEFHTSELLHHFDAEEKDLFPLTAKAVPGSAQVIAELTEEHAAMARAVESFKKPAGDGLREELAAFGRLLESHIRKEDRILFPMIEEQAPDYVLEKIGRDIAARYAGRPRKPAVTGEGDT